MFSWLRLSTQKPSQAKKSLKRKPAGRAWSLEPLEARRLLAVDLLLDIAPGANGSNANGYTQVGDIAYFAANDGTNGMELWKTDGTTAGTVLVKDIATGGASSVPQQLTAFNGKLYFTATDQVNGRELWMSDGTDSGTQLVLDIDVVGSSSPEDLVVLGNELVFSAYDDTNGRELWTSDGTTLGTTLVNDLRPGSFGSSPDHLTKVGNTVFFAASSSDAVGNELWKYEGLGVGASLVRNIADLSFESGNPEELYAAGDKLFFTAFGPSDNYFGRELYVSDGTSNGTFMVMDINPGVADSFASEFFYLNGTTYFSAQTAAEGGELWETDGTGAGTMIVNDYSSGAGNSSPFSLTAVGNDLMVAYNAFNHLVKYDADNNATYVTDGLYPSQRMISVGDKLYFSRADSSANHELYMYDGSTVSLLEDIHIGSNGSYPTSFVAFNNNLLFTANDGSIGTEPWIVLTGPVPAITGLPPSNTIAEGLPINLSQTLSLPGGGGPYTHAWSVQRTGDVGTYATGTSENFSFTPDNNGTYTVTLEVTDADSGVGQIQAVITVTNALPVVTIGGATGANIGSVVNLSALVQDAAADVTAGFTYDWVLEKDNVQIDTGTLANFSFTFTEDATYLAKLTVTDQNNGDGLATHTVMIASVNYVENTFQALLGRGAESDASTYFAEQLENGASYEEVARSVLTSSEYYQDRVDYYYQQVLQRGVDSSGLAYWTERLQNGLSEIGLQTILLTSQEYRGQFNTSAMLVEGLYQTILGRAADADGLNYWTARLDQAGSNYEAVLQSVIEDLLHSEEATTVQINQLYLSILGRQAENSALEYWTARVLNGTETLESMTLQLVISAEFVSVA